MPHSPAKSSLDVGTLIGDTYLVEGLLGRGGMGAVFIASHARLPGKKVAIKVLHTEVANPESLARFRREAEIASRLGHPNIVEVHDFNALPDGTPYLVLEYLDGESLAQRIERGPLSLEQTFTITRQIASALAAAHREQIIHRDLKPQNVFLVPADSESSLAERAKVLDFGISKIRGSTTVQTQDSAILGTPQYMAPEQATGNHAAVDARTDVFALGAMVYEMLAGAPAFTGASIPEVVFKVVYEEPAPLAARVPGLPPSVAAAVERAMAKKIEDRFPGVAELVEALTGTPLAPRRSIAIAPSDGTPPSAATAEAKVKTGEAFAQTMGSGDHAGELGGAQTIGSGDHGAAAAAPPPMPTAVTAFERVPPPAAPATRSRVTLGLVASGLGLLAIGAVIAIAVSRGDGSGRASSGTGATGVTSTADRVAVKDRPPVKDVGARPARTATGSASGSGSASDSASASGSASDSASASASGSASDSASASASDAAAGSASAVDTATAARAAAAKAKAAAAKAAAAADRIEAEVDDDTTPDPDDTAGATGDSPSAPDAAMRALLVDAERSLGDEPEQALRLSRRVLNQYPNNAQAWSVRARAYCEMSDRENAMAAMRKLDGKPRVRRRAIVACRAAGMNL